MPPATPLAGRVTVAASLSANCDASAPRVLYDLRAGICQAGPVGVFFSVTCEPDGSSTTRHFADSKCGALLHAHAAQPADRCSPLSAAAGAWPVGMSSAARCGPVRV